MRLVGRPPSFLEAVEEIRYSVDLSKKEFSDLLGTSYAHYNRILKGQKPFSPDLISRLCQETHISPDAIFSGEIDYLALSSQFHGNPFTLPERYSDTTQHFARTRSTLTLINYLKSLHGTSYVNLILRRLQFRPAMFSNTEGYIHPLILTDLFDELEKSGFHPEQFREMGKVAVSVNKKTPIHSILSQTGTPQQLYQVVHDQIFQTHYDQLFYYCLEKMSAKGLHVVIRPRTDTHDHLKLKFVGGRHTCLYKQGVYASFMGHINRRLPKILETECLYLGDSKCSYRVNWD